jgi:hypothetical protein
MKTVENLEGREMLLVAARGVKGGKVQLTFAQKVDNPNARPSSIVGILNASDDRFNLPGKARYAWMSGEPNDIKSSLDIDVFNMAEGEVRELNIVDPKIQGQDLNIQITESTEGSEYDIANVETRAKRAGKDGDYILTKDGHFIFTKTTVVLGEAKHVFINDTVRASESPSAAASAIDDALNG